MIERKSDRNLIELDLYKHSMKVICIILVISLYAQSCLSESYGPNLIANGDFELPSLSPETYENYAGSFFGWKSSNHITLVCQQQTSSSPGVCPTMQNLIYPDQGIDLDSINHNEKYTYTLNLSQGSYRLEYRWGCQSTKLNTCGFTFEIDQIQYESENDHSCTIYQSIYTVNLTGNSTLSMSFTGRGIPDSLGIIIYQISLRRIYLNESSFNDNSSLSNNSDIPQISVSTFQSILSIFHNSISDLLQFQYIVFKLMTGYMASFNHLLLYCYHRSNYSNTTESYLIFAKRAYNQKRIFYQTYIYPLVKLDGYENETSTQFYDQLFEENIPLGLKYEIVDAIIDLIIIFCIYGMLYLLSKGLDWMIFKKYNLVLPYVVVFLDGKIQVLTFYCVCKIMILSFSNSFNKIMSSASIIFFFSLIILSICITLALKQRKKRRKAKQTSKFSIFKLKATFALFSIGLGSIHRVAAFNPLIQLISLSFFQFYFFFSTILCLKRSILKIQKIHVVSLFLSLLRVLLQATIYANLMQNHSDILSTLEQILFNVYFGSWLFSILLQCLIFTYQAFKRIIQKCKKSNKIQHYDYVVAVSLNHARIKKNQPRISCLKNVKEQNNTSYKRRVKRADRRFNNSKMALQILHTNINNSNSNDN